MENKVRYDDAMAADDIGVSVWALRCNVRAREHICTLSDASMYLVIQLLLHAAATCLPAALTHMCCDSSVTTNTQYL